jgi:SH3-like domain-containing protein
MKAWWTVALLLAAAGAAWAQGALPIPRFVSLRSNQVNVRIGPGMQYPVTWVFVREGLPVEVIGTFDVWRKVRDIDGVEGWVHQNLLSGERHAIVLGEVRTLTRTPNGTVPAVLAEPGVIGRVLECAGANCRLEVGGYKGWLPREQIWGVYPAEKID